MDFGAAIFFPDYSIGPATLGRALEGRGFGSRWTPEHSHIPLVLDRCATLMRQAQS